MVGFINEVDRDGRNTEMMKGEIMKDKEFLKGKLIRTYLFTEVSTGDSRMFYIVLKGMEDIFIENKIFFICHCIVPRD